MEQRVQFTPNQVINANWAVTGNLARLFAWLVFWIANLLLALIGCALLWWFQVTPDQIAKALLGWSQSTTASLLGAAGLSLMGVLAGYLLIAKWLWKKLYIPWQIERLMTGVR